MHAHKKFDASNAWTQRESALDKHQNLSKVHSFVAILEHQVTTVIGLINAQHEDINTSFLFLFLHD